MKWIYLLAAAAAALLTLREALLHTRGRRFRRADSSVPVEPPTLRTRIVRRAAWPIFLAMIGLVALAAMLAAVLVAPR